MEHWKLMACAPHPTYAGCRSGLHWASSLVLQCLGHCEFIVVNKQGVPGTNIL